LGLKLIAGRDFLNSEYQPTGSASGYKGVAAVPSLILTKGLAEKYFPDGDALGRSLYLPNGHPILIIGIVDHLLRPQPTRASDADESVLMPLLPDQQEVVYVVRTDSPNREHVLRAVQTELARLDSRRLIQSARPYSDLRDDYFSADRSMLELLCAAGTGLIFVAVISIGGLANFWVMQRRRQIGIRRALGATRTDIRRYFQLENLVLVGTGALLGAALAPFLGGLLMARFESPSLPYHYLPIAAVLFCAVGQLSVLAPALGASHIAPASAMRNS
jgi:putative ABC transport system permease protein